MADQSAAAPNELRIEVSGGRRLYDTPEDAQARLQEVGADPEKFALQKGSDGKYYWQAVGEVTPPAPPGDDRVKNDFLAGRAMAQLGNLDEQWGSLLGPKAKPIVPNVQRRPVPENDNAPPSVPPEAVTESTAAQEEGPRQPGNFHPMPGPPNPFPVGQKIIGDVLRGLTELPRATVRGLSGAAMEGTKSSLDVATALRSVMPDWLRNSGLGLTDDTVAKIEQAAGKPVDQAGRDLIDAIDPRSYVNPPTSTTGKVEEGGIQFMAGRMPFLAAGKAAGLAGLGKELVADFGAGFFTTDPDQERLSNIIDQAAPNFITDWLKAKPGEEPDLLQRLKSGLEYAGLGAAFSGITKAVRWAKGALSAGASSGPDVAGLGEGASGRGIPPATGPAAPVTPSAEFSGEGLESAAPTAPRTPAFTVSEEAASQAEAYLRGETGANPVTINLERIGSGDDVKSIIEKVSTFIPKGASISHDETQMAADALGVTPEDFLRGIRGAGFSREQILAGRMVLDSAADNFGQLAARAAGPEATLDDKAAAIKAFAILRAVQGWVEGAKAEAGRTLESLKILSTKRADFTAAMQRLIAEGGADDLDTMLSRAADLRENPAQLSAFVAQSTRLPGRDALLYGFYNTLLSYKTAVKKIASDTGMVFWNLATRATAENAPTMSGGVIQGETAQLAYGYVSALGDAFRAAGKGLKTGESAFYADYQSLDALRNAPSRLSMLAAGAPDVIPATEPTRIGMSYLRSALPTSWIGAADDFFKVLNYRAELTALAYREGIGRGMAEGSPELAQYVRNAVGAPSSALHQQALSAALRTTFHEPLDRFSQMIMDARDGFNIPIRDTGLSIPVGRVLMPFVSIPANIMRTAYRNSPLAYFFPSSVIRGELASGGAARDLAVARMWLGSAAVLTTADLVLLGRLTGRGPADPSLNQAWRNARNEPYSIRIGDQWYGYRAVEPFGMLLGTVADTLAIMKFARDPDRNGLGMSLLYGAGNAMLSASYLSSMSDFLDGMHSPDQSPDKIPERLLSTFAVPNAAANLGVATDPFYRAHYGYLDSVEARIPWHREGLPPSRTIWGKPIPTKDAFLPPFSSDSAIAKFLSPIPTAPAEGAEPIDKWIFDNYRAFPHGDQNRLGLYKAGLTQTFSAGNGVATEIQLSPRQLDRLQELAGNGMPINGTKLGAMDYLNSLIAGSNPDRMTQREWNQGTPEERALIVQKVVQGAKAAAKARLIGRDGRPPEFPDLRDSVDAGLNARADALRGAAPAPIQ